MFLLKSAVALAAAAALALPLSAADVPLDHAQHLELGALQEALSKNKGRVPTKALVDAAQDGRYREALALYDAMDRRGSPNAQARYFAAWSSLELHEPERAKRLFREAQLMRYIRSENSPTFESLYQRLEAQSRLAPKPAEPAPTADPRIQVFAETRTDWNGPVLDAVPSFLDVGLRVYGNRLPSVRLDLIAEPARYKDFWLALFGQPVKISWEDGTGTIGLALFCEKGLRGDSRRPAGEPETIGEVLHELQHAWMQTYLMDRYSAPARNVERWLDEGFAEYVASIRDPEHLARSDRRVRAAVKNGRSAPPFSRIRSWDDFYKEEDADLRYEMSALLAARLLGRAETGAALIPRVLDSLGTGSSSPEAVRKATGKDPETEYAALVAEYWTPVSASKSR